MSPQCRRNLLLGSIFVIFFVLAATSAAWSRHSKNEQDNASRNENVGESAASHPAPRTIDATPEQREREHRVYEILKRAEPLVDEAKYVQARQLLLEAASLDPTRNSGNVHSILGFVSQKLGDVRGAIEENKKALQLEPKLVDLAWNIAIAYKDLGEYDQAREWITRYLSSANPDRQRREAVEGMMKKIAEQSTLNGSASVNSPDYLQSLIGQKGAARWPREQFPLKVFIEKSNKVFGVPEDSDAMLAKSFESWNLSTGKLIPIQLVDNKKEASITVRWTDRISDVKTADNVHLEQGVTQVEAFTTDSAEIGTIKHANITLLTIERRTGKALPSDAMRAVCLHEIGHALGVIGHSPNSADTMYFSNSGRQLPALSRRDKATMNKLYGGETAQQPPSSIGQTDTSASAGFTHPVQQTGFSNTNQQGDGIPQGNYSNSYQGGGSGSGYGYPPGGPGVYAGSGLAQPPNANAVNGYPVNNYASQTNVPAGYYQQSYPQPPSPGGAPYNAQISPQYQPGPNAWGIGRQPQYSNETVQYQQPMQPYQPGTNQSSPYAQYNGMPGSGVQPPRQPYPQQPAAPAYGQYNYIQDRATRQGAP